jgi:anti-sigma regulatory factor (Ser/Thr protein kinase)
VRASIDLPRRFEALADLFAFTADTWRRENLPAALLPRADLVLEELFTNIVKYGRGEGLVTLSLRGVGQGVEVTLTDPDADRFDVTSAPAVDTNLPIEQRRPGGLGLHLIRRLVDSLDYQYAEPERRSRVTFRITDGAGRATGGATGAGDTDA